MIVSYGQQIGELVEGLTWKSAIESPVVAVSVPFCKVQWWNLMGYREKTDPFEHLLSISWDINPSAWYQLTRLFGSLPNVESSLMASYKCPCLQPLYCRYLLMNNGLKWVGVRVYVVETE
ncbi:hypothetical protein [Nibrella saemangeumensis]